MTSSSILVVNDAALPRRVLVRVLFARGLVPLEARSHDEALHWLDATPVDIVLSDYDLGERNANGFDVLLAAQSKRPGAARWMMSSVDPPGLGEAQALGVVHAFLSKPIRLAELDALLHTVRR